VLVNLQGRATVEIADAEAVELYDQLWLLVPRRGAVTAAGKIKHALAYRSVGTPKVDLDHFESEAFTAARTRR
jgi:hypothetical protein